MSTDTVGPREQNVGLLCTAVCSGLRPVAHRRSRSLHLPPGGWSSSYHARDKRQLAPYSESGFSVETVEGAICSTPRLVDMDASRDTSSGPPVLTARRAARSF
jgi:hypothetical protein